MELLAVGPDGRLLPENLAGRKDYDQVQRTLARELARWRKDTNDFDFVPVDDPRGD